MQVSRRSCKRTSRAREVIDAKSMREAGELMKSNKHVELEALLVQFDLSVMTKSLRGPLVTACEVGCQECVKICLRLGADPDQAVESIDLLCEPVNFSKEQKECLQMIYLETNAYKKRLRNVLEANGGVCSSTVLLQVQEFPITDWSL
jgi:hypothetical protein